MNSGASGAWLDASGQNLAAPPPPTAPPPPPSPPLAPGLSMNVSDPRACGASQCCVVLFKGERGIDDD